MNAENTTRFFLGANSRYGFYSLYDGFTDPGGGDFLWVIKGGPGCGKSSFMKKIGSAAQDAGLPVEYIQCSGDPDSLDAVWLPTLRTGYADGTSPHVLDAVYPGAASLYLDLGTFYDAGALESRLNDITDLNRQYKLHYARAYDCIAASAAVSPKMIPWLWGEAEKDKLRKKLLGLAKREFRHSVGNGICSQRFLSAVSCQGHIFLQDTLKRICRRVCTLDNELGMAHFYLDGLAQLASEQGLNTILCRDPIDPELLEAVLLPELSLGFLAEDSRKKYSGDIYRHFRLDAIADRNVISNARPEIKRAKKLSDELLCLGISSLAKAKELHDELEGIYNTHVDFDGVYSVAQDHISWLLER